MAISPQEADPTQKQKEWRQQMWAWAVFVRADILRIEKELGKLPTERVKISGPAFNPGDEDKKPDTDQNPAFKEAKKHWPPGKDWSIGIGLLQAQYAKINHRSGDPGDPPPPPPDDM